MKTYRIKISPSAKQQFRRYIWYLVEKKKNLQAAAAVNNDFEETIDRLSTVAGSMRFCDDKELADEGIRKIFFKKHDYVVLYSLESDVVEIHAVYHTLQDYENLFKLEEEKFPLE